VHPGQSLRLGVPGDDRIRRVSLVDGERHERDLADRQAVVSAGYPVGQDPPRHRQPGRPDGGRLQDLRPVARQWCRHHRIVRTARR
jgi:hypothetical protein